MAIRRFTWAVLVAALTISAPQLRAAKSHVDMGEKLPDRPPLPAIVALQLEPGSLTLLNGRDARQVLVWGVAADGRKFDVTDLAEFKSESPAVVIDKDHYVHATQVGDDQITVSALGQEAKLAVKVNSDAVPKVRFVRDIEPVL